MHNTDLYHNLWTSAPEMSSTWNLHYRELTITDAFNSFVSVVRDKPRRSVLLLPPFNRFDVWKHTLMWIALLKFGQAEQASF